MKVSTRGNYKLRNIKNKTRTCSCRGNYKSEKNIISLRIETQHAYISHLSV